MPRGTQVPHERESVVAYGAVTRSDGTFQNPSAKDLLGNSLAFAGEALQPRHALRCDGLGSSPFARHY